MFATVCANSVFPGMALEKTLPLMVEVGVTRYEFWSWWDQDLEAVRREQERYGLMPMLMCTKGFTLNDPAVHAEYMEGLRESMEACGKLGCRTLITQVGLVREGVSREEQHESIVLGLREAGRILKEAGLKLVFEPLNDRIDHPGYYLTAAKEAFEIAREVEMDNVKVLYDLYHQQVSEGIDLECIRRNIDRIGHFHAAGVPGRHEPFTKNEIDYEALIRAIADMGYQGGIGLEYFPETSSETLKNEWNMMTKIIG